MNALNRLIDNYDVKLDSTRRELAVAEGQLKDFEGRIGRPFEHEAYKSELTDLRDKLKLGLSDRASEEGKEAVAEVAERIKALRAANAVEGTPERTGMRKAARAERPVTSRIRERMAVETAEGAGQPQNGRPVEKVQEVQVKQKIAFEDSDPTVGACKSQVDMEKPVKPLQGYRDREANRKNTPQQLRLF